MALGADLALPPSILADRISAQNKIREATQYYALLAFIPKMAIAFASFIIFVFLDRIGFVAGARIFAANYEWAYTRLRADSLHH